MILTKILCFWHNDSAAGILKVRSDEGSQTALFRKK